MNKKTIEKAFEKLNELCKLKNIRGEIGVVGGAAMTDVRRLSATSKGRTI